VTKLTKTFSPRQALQNGAPVRARRFVFKNNNKKY